MRRMKRTAPISKRCARPRRLGRRRKSAAPTRRGRGVAGLVLAGGQGTRLGGRDKGLVRRCGRPMVVAPSALLRAHCAVVLISANRNLRRYARFADRVIADSAPGYPGPLAGIQAAFRAIRAPVLVVVPCDAPDLRPDLPVRLIRALRLQGGAQAAVVRDDQRLQPLIAALRGNLGASLDGYLRDGGRSVQGWLATLRVAEVRVRGTVANHNASPGHRLRA
jgi:molybdenum cofactor guanylyltransferase